MIPISIEMMSKRAISFNGRLYRNAGYHVHSEYATEFHPFMVGENTLNLGRGRSMHFETTTHATSPEDDFVAFSPVTGSDDTRVKFSSPKFEQHHDLFVLSDLASIPNGAPRFVATYSAPKQEWWSVIHSKMKARRVSLIVIDGHLVWLGKKPTLQTRLESIPELNVNLSTFEFWSWNATEENVHEMTNVVANWDQKLWQVGTNVFATTEEEAHFLHDFLSPNRITSDGIRNPKTSSVVITESEREKLEREAQTILTQHRGNITETIKMQELRNSVPMTAHEKYDLARMMLGRFDNELQSAIDVELKKWMKN